MDEIIIEPATIFSIKETIVYDDIIYDELFLNKINTLLTEQSYKSKHTKKPVKYYREKKSDYKFIKTNSHVLKAVNGDDQNCKKIIGFLNKLTAKNLEILSKSIKENLLDEKSTKFLIDLIFKNAIIQPKNCVVYVNLCLDLSEYLLSKFNITIEKIIIDKCNLYLEELNENIIIDNNYDEFCENIKKKNCNIGNIQLIGELYLKELIDYNTISKIVNFLFENTNPDNLKIEDKDYLTINIECLCTLLTNIYKKNNNIITKNIELIKTRYVNKVYPSKARICLMDIIDIYEKKIII